ncbi:hypothetical protein P4534_00185 [Peribacillus butanolivorans]|uniref:GNAT family N-acetyltransferase n=1 Tax=Peribacillus butanolivorans TaxID=421767 RepID=UPI002E24C462|nr:hypothetical protein [Peribacillus butanolivorans]
MIRQMKLTDLDVVLTIYGEGLKTGCATFETTIPSKEKWNSSHHKTLRFVAETGEQVVEWIALFHYAFTKSSCPEITPHNRELIDGAKIKLFNNCLKE